jgi:hypothetical protein
VCRDIAHGRESGVLLKASSQHPIACIAALPHAAEAHSPGRLSLLGRLLQPTCCQLPRICHGRVTQHIAVTILRASALSACVPRIGHSWLQAPRGELTFACLTLQVPYHGTNPQRASAIALILLQYFVVAVQLLCSQQGKSSFLPPLPALDKVVWAGKAADPRRPPPGDLEPGGSSIAEDPSQPPADQEVPRNVVFWIIMSYGCKAMRTLLILLALTLMVPVLDLAAACSLWVALNRGGGSSPQDDEAGSEGSSAVNKFVSMAPWLRQYVRRRLGIAGLLQACPQVFFHLYVAVLPCTYYMQWSRCKNNNIAFLAVAFFLDIAVLVWDVFFVGAMANFCKVVTEWLSWRTWGALLREVLDCTLYIADVGFDVYFVMVSRSAKQGTRPLCTCCKVMTAVTGKSRLCKAMPDTYWQVGTCRSACIHIVPYVEWMTACEAASYIDVMTVLALSVVDQELVYAVACSVCPSLLMTPPWCELRPQPLTSSHHAPAE